VTFQAAHNTIRNHALALVAESSLLGTDDVAWDNAPFSRQDGGDAGLWCRMAVNMGESRQRDLGSLVARTTGILLISVFVPAETGDKLALQFADEAVTHFKSAKATLSGTVVQFETPSVRAIGLRDSWWQVNVACPFFTDDA
jgi:hypothetical protein